MKSAFDQYLDLGNVNTYLSSGLTTGTTPGLFMTCVYIMVVETSLCPSNS